LCSRRPAVRRVELFPVHLATAELRAILAHNRDGEKEHAAMELEWIRRRDPRFDHELRDCLPADKPIAHD